MKLTIGWLYPELMSTYGDRGNIITLKMRCLWRGIDVTIRHIDQATTEKGLSFLDIVIGGGAQDRQQEIVIQDLMRKKDTLQKLFNRGVPGLFVCGSPQLLGHYYMTSDGKKLPGLGIFDMATKRPSPGSPRLIGNLVAKLATGQTVVGFENHNGRTYLGKVKPLAQVLVGHGNNDEDKTEGAIYQNVIATYSHGPLLPKNPHVADWLIKTALEVKYKKELELEPLDDALEWRAHDFMLKKLGVL